MKTILFLILFLPLMIFGQDVRSYDDNLVFKESFTDELTTRRNGGTPTDVTFSSGSGSFNGSSSIVTYPQIAYGSNFSVRAKFLTSITGQMSLVSSRTSDSGFELRFDSGTAIEFDSWFSGFNSLPCTTVVNDGNVHDVIITFDGTTKSIYVDGDFHASTIKAGSIGNQQLAIGRRVDDATFYYNGSISLVEIYNKALTANEVSNLYNGVYYKPLTKDWLFDVDSRLGVIQDNVGNAISNTSTTIARNGEFYTASYDGADSKLDLGTIDNLTGDLTFIAWVKSFDYGEGNRGRIIDNGKLLLVVTDQSSSDRYRLQSDASTSAFSASNALLFNIWQLIIVTRNAVGDEANLYIDGVLSGSADQDSGTPVAGSTNIIIGNDNGQATTFGGLISRPRIVKSILTVAEISQIYSSEKRWYK